MKTYELQGYTFYKVAEVGAVEQFELKLGYSYYEFRLMEVKDYLEKHFGLDEPLFVAKLEAGKIDEKGILRVYRIDWETYLLVVEGVGEKAEIGNRAFILEKKYKDDEEEDWQELCYIKLPKHVYILITDRKTTGVIMRKLILNKWVIEMF